MRGNGRSQTSDSLGVMRPRAQGLWLREGSAFSIEVADYMLNDSAKLTIKCSGIISMDSGDKAGASTDIDLFFVAPIAPFMALIELFNYS